jgi:hypothetical protein
MNTPVRLGLKSVALDGSAIPLLKTRLAERIKKVLATAKERKRLGVGVMARPEADAGLLPLFQVLHRLEPEQRWLEKALVTLVHTLNHALLNAEKVWWGFTSPRINWRYHFETTKYNSLIAECENSEQIKNNPALAKYLALAREYLLIAETLAGRSFSKDLTVAGCKPLSAESFAPEWDNSSQNLAWPVASKQKKEKIGQVVFSTFSNLPDNAFGTLEYGSQILNGERRPQGTETNWLHSVNTFDRVSAKFVEVSYLDRVFGGSAEDFLSALLGYSRYEYYQEIWTNHISYGCCHVPTALAVNDQSHLVGWANMIKRDPSLNKFGYVQMLVKLFLNDGQEKIKSVLKSDSAYTKADYLAVKGLLEQKTELVEEGISGMLANYHKINYAVWQGNWLSEICVPAVAIQRAAIRAGMKINIPTERPNDPELILLPDPTEARLPYCLYPGIETLLSHKNLAWPALLLDEPITRVEG